MTFPIERYIERREECLAGAASAKLANEKKRHLDAAEAWQKIIDTFAAPRSGRSSVA
jgi:hypothetical protein